MSDLLVKQEVSFQDLKPLAGQPNNKRVGATVNPKNRKKQYRSQGYTGTFYYAEVQNMKMAEQELLRCIDTRTCPCNVDRDSKAPDSPGYVYVIQWLSEMLQNKGQEMNCIKLYIYNYIRRFLWLHYKSFYLHLEEYTLTGTGIALTHRPFNARF